MEEISKMRLTLTKVSPPPTVEQRQIVPRKIWDTLTAQQQQQLYQRLVGICYHLSKGNSIDQEEVKDERD